MKLLSEFLPWISSQNIMVFHSSQNISSTPWSSNSRTNQDLEQQWPSTKYFSANTSSRIQIRWCSKEPFSQPSFNIVMTRPLNTAGSPISDYDSIPSPGSVSCHLVASMFSPAQQSSMISHKRSIQTPVLKSETPLLQANLVDRFLSTSSHPNQSLFSHQLEPTSHTSEYPHPKAFLISLIYGILPAHSSTPTEQLF